jgi:hypothetical protein
MHVLTLLVKRVSQIPIHTPKRSYAVTWMSINMDTSDVGSFKDLFFGAIPGIVCLWVYILNKHRLLSKSMELCIIAQGLVDYGFSLTPVYFRVSFRRIAFCL